jgi:dolichol-phosphate mannosyltransferase
MVGLLSGVKLHDHNCGFKCLRHEVLAEIQLYGERHRFIPVLAAAQGFRVEEVAVEHRARTEGKSKYGWSRIPKGLLDLWTIPLVTRFRNRPQHWLGSTGLVALLLGGICMTYLACCWGASRLLGGEPVHLHETASLYYSMVLVILGAQFLSAGLVAELLVSVMSRDQGTFSIRETTADAAVRDRVAA